MLTFFCRKLHENHELRGLKFDFFFSNLDAKTFFGGGSSGGVPYTVRQEKPVMKMKEFGPAGAVERRVPGAPSDTPM